MEDGQLGTYIHNNIHFSIYNIRIDLDYFSSIKILFSKNTNQKNVKPLVKKKVKDCSTKCTHARVRFVAKLVAQRYLVAYGVACRLVA